MTFLFLWEGMSVASYFLVLTESDQRETRQAALWYLAMAHAGLMLLMAAFLLVAAGAASTGFADLRIAAAACRPLRATRCSSSRSSGSARRRAWCRSTSGSRSRTRPRRVTCPR
jgi:formate hydrogenlyase subunit 3/multisubunit Na+/H+ antiporter MnhD subunit